MSKPGNCTVSEAAAGAEPAMPEVSHVKETTRALQALLVGQNRELTVAAIPLLKRAGFAVDLVSPFAPVEYSSSCRSVHRIAGVEHIGALLEQLLATTRYDLIVLGDDGVLLHVLQSSLSDEMKEQILPIVSLANAGHLYSKIGLSELLAASGILTPRFACAASREELISASGRIGFPLLVKLDRSGGGSGVFCCDSLAQLAAGFPNYHYPVLVQEFVQGEVIDLSGFYQEGRLVHFMYSRFEKTIGGKFGPSSVRCYRQLGTLEPQVFSELGRLGCVLGADGFASVTAIQSARDGRRYYIEADMRPNVWVDYGRHMGNDAATAIARYFACGETLRHPPPVHDGYPKSAMLPFVSRLSLPDLLRNAHGCWGYMEGPTHFVLLSSRKANEQMVRAAVKLVKPWLPQRAWLALKDGRRKITDWLAATVSFSR